MNKLQEKIAKYNQREITLKIWERNIILGVLFIAALYFLGQLLLISFR